MTEEKTGGDRLVRPPATTDPVEVVPETTLDAPDGPAITREVTRETETRETETRTDDAPDEDRGNADEG